MKTRKLGKTGLEVGELSLGGLFVSSWGGEFEQTSQAVRRALELGVNYVDTAPGYGNSEEVLGRALEGATQPFVLSTKLGGRPQHACVLGEQGTHIRAKKCGEMKGIECAQLNIGVQFSQQVRGILNKRVANWDELNVACLDAELLFAELTEGIS